MKILVIQLARLGDIYITWPALRALRRQHPEAEIHLLTRPRFESAVHGLEAIDKHKVLSVSHILEPMVKKQSNIELKGSLQRLERFVDELKAEKYDLVVNFTFSPFSSYLTHALTALNTKVLGYTRHTDGYLNFADEVSAYFYAQVGIERSNRVHVADIFASMLGLEFTEADWAAPSLAMPPGIKLPDNYVVVHVGASESHKALSAEQWIRFLTYLTERKPHLPIVLVGASEEKKIAQEVLKTLPTKNIHDLVGKTQVSDLFPILQNAIMLVGCDSAPIHMASLTDTATLNISVGRVNFWETGPKATHGFIYRVENPANLVPQRIAEVFALLLEGTVSPELVGRGSGLTSYQVSESAEDRFRWDLTHAIYLSGSFPVTNNLRFYEAMIKLEEVNLFIVEQLLSGASEKDNFAEILNRAEEIIQSISQLVPETNPIVSWYQAEKVRIRPGPREEVLAATLTVHQSLDRILKIYIPAEETKRERLLDGQV